mmetsp:Transcript_22465/g.53899  ORF Transcript_22465/g.53899 Transcript_22465/m.53899 type:complete len:971 (+) Transcript_22465:80-2992(+)|eukprot:CAMPEP_0180133990 /NCGR_PEP_ID=MMETSP0986-20121125/9869_1 /TAXON_ID=697907 /ORGANISM="non described non described, Strain CCMP2293" /LENGTH=970 /DNA_ID=CAMNT_0022074213 /DNA_START=76 /DNA_END=2988 /DNA_ORIENTATION=+
MKFAELLEQAARSDWASHYVNYKRAKKHIKSSADATTYKGFITEECIKVEKFYLQKVEELKADSVTLTTGMSQGGASVAGLVKRSWNHTEDLRGLYDFGRLNWEGIRKSLKKYDKVMQGGSTLQTVYFQQLKTQYQFFAFRDDLKDLLEKCATFWNQDTALSKLQGRDASEIRDSLPQSFPLKEQFADQGKADSTETEGEDSDDDEKKRRSDDGSDDGSADHTPEEEKDREFARDFKKQRERKPEWQKSLADYQMLNDVLRQLAQVAGAMPGWSKNTSLSMSNNPDAAYGQSPVITYNGKPFKEVDWFKLVDVEMDTVSKVTNGEVSRVRAALAVLRDRCESWSKDTLDTTAEQSGARARAKLSQLGVLEQQAKQVGDDFISLEKFVNLNYQAFEKLLKNHDKLLPNTPCHQFYMAKLRNQDWIKSDFSDVFVALSDCHSLLRQDDAGVANNDAAQNFVRNTKKYWVPTEHVSTIKHVILQHLPVFRMWAGSGDSQLVNSVYFDNRQMQLYHGRMDKTPGAIALRLRWYGTEIKNVYVERKTHLDSWTGNVSVKERFSLEPEQVVPYLNGSYKVNEFADDMKRKGKKDTDIQAACKLFSQIARVIESKQLGPTVRTQYMRTAFQIPFDSSVRISLDTNLAMVREDTCGYASTITERWRRDERNPVKASEHTHFPHAILEVKLQGEVENPAQWVQDLLGGGMCTEVYKFSKFIHGGAVLLTELVAAAPYWIDDVSIRESVNASAPSVVKRTGKKKSLAPPDSSGAIQFASADNGEDEDDEGHPLLGQMRPSSSRASNLISNGNNRGDDRAAQTACFGLITRDRALPRKVPIRVEPKTMFANERTFLAWLHMSVTLGSISSALTVFSEDDTKKGAGTQIMSLGLTLVAALFVAHASHSFYTRRAAIRRREDAGNDQILMPIGVAVCLVVSLVFVFIANLSEVSSPSAPTESMSLSSSAVAISTPYGLLLEKE